MSKKLLDIAGFLLPWVIFLALWTIGARRIGIPSPLSVLATVPDTVLDENVRAGFFSTVARSVFSFVVSAGAGTALALLPGTIPSVRNGFDGFIDFMRSIPVPVLLPVFMGILGLYQGPKLALAIFGCTLVNAVYISYGVKREMRAIRTKVAELMGGSKIFIFRVVVVPAIIEDLFAGLRVTLSLSLVLSTLGELFLLTGNGAGVLIRLAYEDRNNEVMYALILMLGLVGVLMNKVFLRIEDVAMAFRYGVSVEVRRQTRA